MMRIMPLRRLVAAAILVAALPLGGPAVALTEAVVLRVVTVQTTDLDAYVKDLEHGKSILKRMGSQATIRMWRARFAGENAGQVVVSVEWPTLAAFARDDEKMKTDTEYTAWLKGLDRLRKVVSDSLYHEVKP